MNLLFLEKLIEDPSLWKGLVGIVIVIFAVVKWRESFKKYLQDKREDIRKNIDKAYSLREEARKLLDKYETMLLNTEKEINYIKKDIKNKADEYQRTNLILFNKRKKLTVKRYKGIQERQHRFVEHDYTSKLVDKACVLVEQHYKKRMQANVMDIKEAILHNIKENYC